MSFYHLPNPWNPGYAIPKYVMAEPPERGTFTTQWLPRGTIPTLVPDFLAVPGKRLLGRADAGLGSLGGCTLGDAASDAAAAAAAAAGQVAVNLTAPKPVDTTTRDTIIGVAAVGVVGLIAYSLLRKKR